MCVVGIVCYCSGPERPSNSLALMCVVVIAVVQGGLTGWF